MMAIHEMREEDYSFVMEHIRSITMESVFKECTPRGNGKSIKTAGPEDGFYYWIWRWARFYNGEDVTQPVMAYVYLSRAMARILNLDPKKHSIILELDPKFKPMLDILDARATDLVNATGGNFEGLHRWGRVLGVLK